MSEFKGTKGKWEINTETESRIVMLNGSIDVWDFDKDRNLDNEEYKANAQLISKAPEMLEEIKHLVKALKAVNSFGATKPIIEHAEQLIKEATKIQDGRR